ncbi:glucokinase regulatory protein-like [Oscarella lobularis]|uniref:glucokinase regulatory protein-like n=1 Tax=Oscarella lobularis TaxID=121494 RepID=UPI0033131E7A
MCVRGCACTCVYVCVTLFSLSLSLYPMAKTLRISEMSNEATRGIDAAKPAEMLAMLHESDEQMFSGWQGNACVYSDVHLRTIERLAERASSMLEENMHKGANNAFVFSGCGTSGRVGWLCCRAFNQVLEEWNIRPCFHYLIAGGDQALIVSKEMPEDDPIQGSKELEKTVQDFDTTLFFGITCGLSAPYVAGQIDYALNKENIIPVLVGFNPVSLARDSFIEKWPVKNCKDVFLNLQASEKGFILNPIVGPESITGSTRMKGGSMTKILLDVIFLAALNKTLTSHKMVSRKTIINLVDLNHRAAMEVYRASVVTQLSSVIEIAGECLREPNGHLYYVGSGEFALTGLVDGSEMVDTYGAGLDEIRGFVDGGWAVCRNKEGDLSDAGGLFRISIDDFVTDVVPTLSKNDLVIWLEFSCLLPAAFLRMLSDSPAQLARLSLSKNKLSENGDLNFRSEASLLPATWGAEKEAFHLTSLAEHQATQLTMKLAVNAISTCANVLKGRVYGNAMINLTVANDKLFYRSIEIVSQLSSAPRELSRVALLTAIYDTDTVTEEIATKPVSEHIQKATSVQMVVPKAILLASGKATTINQATSMLQSTASIRLLMTSRV